MSLCWVSSGSWKLRVSRSFLHQTSWLMLACLGRIDLEEVIPLREVREYLQDCKAEYVVSWMFNIMTSDCHAGRCGDNIWFSRLVLAII